jgi:hypothetical protein
MKSLFIITSAIYTSYGKCSTEERIDQTKETIRSIKTYAPDADTIIIDCGEKSVDQSLFECEVIDYTKNNEVQIHLNHYLKTNTDLEPDIIIKSMLEIIMFENFLKTKLLDNYSRIFKISGRYKLNSNFNYEMHLNAKDKVVILPPERTQHLYNTNVISSSIFQYMTRCWSFDSSLISIISDIYYKMKIDIISTSKTKKQCDIEHLLYKHLAKNIVSHTNIMGIEGYWAPLKIWFEE